MSAAIKKHIEENKARWYAPKDFNYAALDKTATTLHFVAYPAATPPPGTKPTNHWVIFIEIAQASPIASIRIDPTPGDGVNLTIALSQKPYSVTSHFVHEVKAPVGSNTTAAALLQLLISNNRDWYQFTDTGEGCRFWIKTIAEDQYKASKISKTDYDKLSTDIALYFKDKTSPGEGRPIEAGKFTKPK